MKYRFNNSLIKLICIAYTLLGCQTIYGMSCQSSTSSPFMEPSKAEAFVAKEIGPQYTDIIKNEPGVLSRVKHFVRFGKKQISQEGQIAPNELLQRYSELLGTKTYYRGLALTELEFQFILENGLELPSKIGELEAKRAVSKMGLTEAINRRVGLSLIHFAKSDLESKGNYSPTNEEVDNYIDANLDVLTKARSDFLKKTKHLSSITSDPSAAAWVATTSQKNGKKIYTFEITVSTLNTIHGNSFESWLIAPVRPENISLHKQYTHTSFHHTDFLGIMREPKFNEYLPEIP